MDPLNLANQNWQTPPKSLMVPKGNDETGQKFLNSHTYDQITRSTINFWSYFFPSIPLICRYQLMADCWNEDPDARPTFDHLHEVMTGFLQEEVTISIRQNTLLICLSIHAISKSVPFSQVWIWSIAWLKIAIGREWQASICGQ